MQTREIIVKSITRMKIKPFGWFLHEEFFKMHLCGVIPTSVCMGPDGNPMSWKGTLSFWACDCGGRTGVSPASLSEVWTLSSFSRKVSTLCSRGAVLVGNEGGWFSQGLENSRCRALGEGRWETEAPLWAFRRAWRISHSFGETLLIGNKHQKVGNVTKSNVNTWNAVHLTVQTANASSIFFFFFSDWKRSYLFIWTKQ